MRYLVILKYKTAFITDWYQYENHWTDEVFCIYDRLMSKITYDGQVWQGIDEDHL